MNTIIQLALFFDVSADYLLGLSDKKINWLNQVFALYFAMKGLCVVSINIAFRMRGLCTN
jgi:hypothetical protein